MSKKIRNEAGVKDAIKKVLDAWGAWYYMPVQTGYGQHGIPDIIACYRGFFIAIEAKFGNNKPSAWQERQLAGIKKSEGVAMVVNEKNLEAVPRVLGEVEAQYEIFLVFGEDTEYELEGEIDDHDPTFRDQ